MKRLLLPIIILLGACAHLSAATALRPVTLRCEYRVNPLGVDAPSPRLSWVLESEQRGVRQTAYRLLVASSAALLAKDKADLWDSGKVVSNQSHLVTYAGKPLASHQLVFWKVRVSRSNDTEAESDVASWTMGFLSPEEWSAHWIVAPELGQGLPVFRKTFSVDSGLKKALVNVSGLGHYELFLNGQKVGKLFLDPPWSVYEKTAYYSLYDITDLLKEGEN